MIKEESEKKYINDDEKRRRQLQRKQRKVIKYRKYRKKRKRGTQPFPYAYNSRLILQLEENSFAIKPQKCNEVEFITIPVQFSFTRNPEGTIRFLRELYGIIMSPNVRQVYFDHSKCTNMGICASAIMDILLVECKKWRESRHNKIDYCGKLIDGKYIASNPEVDTLLKASGILRHLGVSHEHFPDVECLELLKNEESSDIAEKR